MKIYLQHESGANFTLPCCVIYKMLLRQSNNTEVAGDNSKNFIYMQEVLKVICESI